MLNHDELKDQESRRALVCALADGQLYGQEFAQVVESIQSDFDSRATWHAYHVIGDVLRSQELAEHADSLSFVARFQSRLAADSEAQQAYLPSLPVGAASDLSEGTTPAQASANESVFAWKLTAGFASLAAVVAMGWSVSSGLTGASSGAQLAQAQPPAQVSVTSPGVSESVVMIRDPNLDALLAAHKQFGGATALQMPTGFLRNATFEGAAR